MDQQRTVTLDDKSLASLPAGVPVNRLRWLWYYPKWPFIWFVSCGIATWLTVTVSWRWGFLSVPLFLMNLLYWYRVKEHFAHGCACAGMVIHLKPTLVAVFTDLTKGEGTFPVIKIIPLRPWRIMGKRPEVGMRVPTAALYDGTPADNPRWAGFNPIPIGCANGDVDYSLILLDEIPEDEWRCLERGVDALPSYEPGLYHLSPSDLR